MSITCEDDCSYTKQNQVYEIIRLNACKFTKTLQNVTLGNQIFVCLPPGSALSPSPSTVPSTLMRSALPVTKENNIIWFLFSNFHFSISHCKEFVNKFCFQSHDMILKKTLFVLKELVFTFSVKTISTRRKKVNLIF